MLLTDAITRVRTEIGDPPQAFMDSTLSDGSVTWFDLSVQYVNTTGLTVQVIGPSGATTLSAGQYSMDYENGQITLGNPVPAGQTLQVMGSTWSMFTDSDLTQYITDAASQHTLNQFMTERYRDRYGFITFREVPKTMANLPQIEEPLIVMLATINVLWTLATDTATDVDIQTAEGTNISRAQRYSQTMNHINALTTRYMDYCGQLNVGLYRMETLRLRRHSLRTGRLIPLFKEREYDDHRFPVREIPQVDVQNEDDSGVVSPLWSGWAGSI